jgi:NTE family protein
LSPRRVVCLFLLALFLAASCFSQQSPAPPERKRKTVGLALSGGAALGLAHVGVIEWFEEHHIPIDYVAGTSMGALVGGLYATGSDSGQMTAFLSGVDWDAALAATPPFKQLMFRRKQDRVEYTTSLELGLGHGIKLPSGLSPGQGVGLVISRFAAPYGGMKSFDNLPTPFRCVATDLVTTKAVVFSNGDLYDALRASMSLPALFSPVRKGNQILVDGGLVDNLPVDLVKKMGADVVIAIELNRPPEPEAYQSLLGIAGRSISVMISQNEVASLAAADLVVAPNLDGLSASDYSAYESFRKVGYEAAEKRRFFLEKLAVSDAEWQEYVERRKKLIRPDTISPQFIAVTGANLAPNRKAALERALEAHAGQPIDRAKLEQEMTRLTGLGPYDTAQYTFAERDGKEGLVIDLHDKTYSPPYLNLGLLIDGTKDSGLRFGVAGRLTFLDFGGPASEMRVDLSIGMYNHAQIEYYYRIHGGKWFVSPRGSYDQELLPFYVQDQRLLDFQYKTAGGGLDVGYAFGRFAEFRAGYEIYHIGSDVQTGPAIVSGLNGTAGDIRVRYSYDKQDVPFLPRQGLSGAIEGRWYTRYPAISEQFPYANAMVSYARPITSRIHINWLGRGGVTANQDSTSVLFRLGGLGQLSSLARYQMLGNRYYYSGTYAFWRIKRNEGGMLSRFYAVGGWEIGDSWSRYTTASPFNDALFGLAGATPAGPIFFGGSVGQNGEAAVLFRLGRIF